MTDTTAVVAGDRFAALRESPNYRRYLVGQSVSLAGTWMQTVAQGWLVLQLTGSGTKVGLVTAAQYLPVLLLAPAGGLLADRVERRRVLLATQMAFALLAAILGILTVTGSVRMWMVYVVAVGFGIVTAADNPARQTFIAELVSPSLITNAVTLNSININAGRIVGPALAAITIKLFGIGTCFLLNAASFIAVMAALATLDQTTMRRRPVMAREPRQLRAGLAYVARTPDLLVPLLMMVLIGTLTYEFQVNLPLLARYTFHGDEGTYSLLTGAMGVGAVIGGIATAGRDRRGIPVIVRQAAWFGLVIAVVAASPRLWIALVGLVFVGWASITFTARANATMQLTANPEMRGRVMALWTMAFLGTTPIGGPAIGFISDRTTPRIGMATQAGASLTAALLGGLWWWTRGRRRRTESAAAH